MAKRTTGDLQIDCAQTGVDYTSDLNSSLSALNSMHRGTTPPVYDLEDGVLWYDTGSTRSVPDGQATVDTTTLSATVNYKISVATSSDWSSVGGPTVAIVGDVFLCTAAATSGELTALGTAVVVPVISGGANSVRVYRAASNNTVANLRTTVISGRTYEIATTVDTDFTLLGASVNTVGTVFLATANGSAATGTGTAWDLNRRFVPLFDFLDVPTPVDATTAPTATAGSDPFLNTKRGVRYPDGTVQVTAASGGGEGGSISNSGGIIRYNETVLNSSHGDINGDIFVGGSGGDNSGETGTVNAFAMGPLTIDSGVSVTVASGSLWNIT